MIERAPDGTRGLAPADASRDGVLSRSIASLRAALALLTRIPAGDPGGSPGSRSFAIVGALVGLAGSLPLVVLEQADPAIAAIMSVATMAVLSGAIHLDGLADTADALVATGPDGAERARKDPAVGVAGVVALILVLGLEIVSLASLLAHGGALVASLACVVAAAASRAVPVVVVRAVATSAAGPGLGAWFATRVSGVDAAFAVATGCLIAVGAMLAIGEPSVILAGLAGGLGGVGLAVGLVRTRRQLDGDLLGAGVELAFAGTLATAAVLAVWTSR
jgi:adenosylcobinamide-GDP ribazoletransferase